MVRNNKIYYVGVYFKINNEINNDINNKHFMVKRFIG